MRRDPRYIINLTAQIMEGMEKGHYVSTQIGKLRGWEGVRASEGAREYGLGCGGRFFLSSSANGTRMNRIVGRKHCEGRILLEVGKFNTRLLCYVSISHSADLGVR